MEITRIYASQGDRSNSYEFAAHDRLEKLELICRFKAAIVMSVSIFLFLR